MPLFRRLALLLTALLAPPFLAGAAVATSSQRIIAIGDLHGDYSAWQAIARSSGLVDAGGHWAAGSTILVQMGDITDREPDSLKIIRSLQQLQREAPRKGGKVFVVLGNHEAMNLLGDNRYTTPGEYQAFVDRQSEVRRERVYESNRPKLEAFYRTKNPSITPDQVRSQWMAEHPLGWVEHKHAWGPSGDLGRWATNNPAILKLGGTLFVHGGISAEYSRQPLETVNARVAKAMSAADDGTGSVLTDPLGPLWYRGLVTKDDEANAARVSMTPATAAVAPDQELATVLAAYGAQRLVVAHTPNITGIRILDNGQLADIDTGISRFYGGPLSWLEISGQQMIPHSIPRTP
jgi:hypothetical protein